MVRGRTRVKPKSLTNRLPDDELEVRLRNAGRQFESGAISRAAREASAALPMWQTEGLASCEWALSQIKFTRETCKFVAIGGGETEPFPETARFQT